MILLDYKIDIIIPVYNEGENIISVLNKFDSEVKTPFKILLCYDHDDDTSLQAIKGRSFRFEVLPLKNQGTGVHSAVMTGFNYTNAECVIVFPADDVDNQNIIDMMYDNFLEGNEVVVASRFIEGGSMAGCPILKSMLVRIASTTLYYLSSIPVRDASNGFRLFSRKILNHVQIESTKGFTYSIELLVKCARLKWPIGEVPAKWRERSKGKSRFQVIRWTPKYLKWYFYGLATTWLDKSPNSVLLKP